MTNEIIPIHPGEILSDEIEALEMTQYEFARRTGILPKTITEIVQCKANITFDIAVKLAKFMGMPDPSLWLNLQARYNKAIMDLENLNNNQNELVLENKIDKKFLFKIFSEKMLDNNCDSTSRMMSSSFELLNTKESFASLKTGVKKEPTDDEYFLRNVWISIAHKKALDVEDCPPFDKKKVFKSIEYLRRLTNKSPYEYYDELSSKLKECGIRLVILPYLKGSNLRGATKWFPYSKSVVVAVSDYGNDLGKFWYSLFHEIGHAYFAHKRENTISVIGAEESDEYEANQFAMNALIHGDEYAALLENGPVTIDRMQRFCDILGIHISILIERLQHDKYIPYNKYNEYKEKFEYINKDSKN